MKISLLKENIENGLNAIERITPKSHTLPILGNVLLETDKNYLKMSGTDLDSAICYWILGKIEQQGKITVPAKLFSDIIRAFGEEKIHIETKQNTLFLSGEYGKAQILGQQPDDFPVIPPIPQDYSIEVNCESLFEGLSSVIDFAAPSQSVRQELMGVYWRIHAKGITFAATDTFRLAEKQLFFSPDEKKFPGKEYVFLTPPRIVREFLAFAQNKKGRVKISVSSSQVAFEYIGEEVSEPRVQFLSRLLEGEFPAYQEIIPQTHDTQVSFPKEKFINLLRAASVMSPKTNEVILHVSPKKKGVEIESKSPDKGEYRSFLTADCTGEELDIHFNWRFLWGGLPYIKSAEVLAGFQKNEKPAVLRPQDDASYVYVVMPMRSS